MASTRMDKLSRERLVLGLERASKGLKKKLGESFEVAMIPAVADELLRLQDKQGVELKSADIPSLRKGFGVDKDQDSLLGVALRVLEIFQTRKDPSSSCDSEENTASCSEEKAAVCAKRKVCAAPAAEQKAEYSEDATYGFVVIQGDYHTLALGTLASFEVKFGELLRFARLADESRLNHLKAVYERMERAFLAQDKSPLVEGIAVGGPGPTKSQFVEHLPRVWSSLVGPQLVTTTSGLQQLLGQLKEQCSSSSEAEKQRLRQRERKEEGKNQKGAQRGGGRAKCSERRGQEEAEDGEGEEAGGNGEENRGKDKKLGEKGESKNHQ